VRAVPGREGGDGAGSRIVRLPSGVSWRATVVARLISDDVTAGREQARLVVQLECLTMRRRALRTIVPGARSLEAVSESALRELIEPNPLRTIRRASSV
jgi:hypothetical protein